MKKYLFILIPVLVLSLVGLHSCSDSDESVQTANNKIDVSNLNDFFKKYGKPYEFTDFDASSQTDITLPGDLKVHIPKGALRDINGTYMGKVIILSREFSSLKDMVMSNYYTMDSEGRPLISGGSFDLMFFDTNYNKLGINDNFKVNVQSPARLKNAYVDRMNFYSGKYEEVGYKGSDVTRNLLVWELTKKPVKYNSIDESYSIDFTPADPIGVKPTRLPCSYYWEIGDFDAWEECLAVDWRNNNDIAPPFGEGVPIEININDFLNPEFVNIAVISAPNTSVIGLVFNKEGNYFTTTTGQYYDFGDVVIAASSVENGEFRYSITEVNTKSQNFNIDLQPGSVEDFENELSKYFN